MGLMSNARILPFWDKNQKKEKKTLPAKTLWVFVCFERWFVFIFLRKAKSAIVFEPAVRLGEIFIKIAFWQKMYACGQCFSKQNP